MGFENLAVTPAARIGHKANVTIALRNGNDKGKPRSVAIRIGTQVLRKLNWVVGDRIMVQEGSGEDLQHIRLIRAPDGYSLSATPCLRDAKAGTFVVSSSMFRHHGMPTSNHPQTEVQFQAFGGDCLIVLPSWVLVPTTV